MKKIAIVDDDSDSRESLAFLVEDAGFDPVLIEGKFGSNKQKLIDQIKAHKVYGVISDHRLTHGKLANFFGSELLATLYDIKMPSILITQFLDVDADTSIRRYRDKLPAVIGRGHQKPEMLSKLIEFSKNELLIGPSATRKPHRAIIRIDDLNSYSEDGTIEGIITNWNSDTKIRFPSDIVPENILKQLDRVNTNRLMAFVNTGANNREDIFITDIHLAPSFEGLDGLD
ncbi:hypothetical protein [Vibrio parahaemolyticus]|uniref:hypothetical protein n=1 Tax=Vibrio parahaemolyticus TaxID=670 RepID=UPI00186A06F0|nr:hypothetical protein [Vibrio parahaemolyticus]MBE4461429.1 hypothetical protein [Vibrio parahaemolyticus]MDN4718441.1 hypothetical protein [Vibrio parahaemolyticus]MDN4728724.1 hypothetical protein [Vibrio parahaemolyticus]